MSSNTPLLTQWLASLPPRTREIIVMAGESIEKFDGNVKMADTIASLAFMRAVESESGMLELDAKDQVELLKTAGVLIQLAAKIKEQRLDVIEKYESLTETPKPSNLVYMEVEAGIPEQIRRLLALNMIPEAEMLCKQNNFTLADFLEPVEVRTGPPKK